MSASVTRIHPELPGPAVPAVRSVSRRSAELDIEAAAQFLLEMDGHVEDAAGGPRLAYLLGLAEGHLVSMLELARGAVSRCES
jgi:hypothetical protein